MLMQLRQLPLTKMQMKMPSKAEEWSQH